MIKLVRVVAVQDMFRKFVQKKGQTKTRHHTNLSENYPGMSKNRKKYRWNRPQHFHKFLEQFSSIYEPTKKFKLFHENPVKMSC